MPDGGGRRVDRSPWGADRLRPLQPADDGRRHNRTDPATSDREPGIEALMRQLGQPGTEAPL